MLKCFSFFMFIFSFISIHAQDEFRLERVKTIPNNATVNDILVHKSSLYIATNVGLYQIDADDLETRLLSKKNIDAVCHVVNSEIWASVEGKYIQNMSSGETTNYNSPGLQVRDLEYSKGKIWIATNQGILTVLTRTNELGKITYEKKSGLPSNDIAFIHIDDQKQMWIGTDKGIVFINTKDKWKTYEKKLSMEAMHYNHEGLWLVSNEEMWVVDPYNRWYPAAIDKGLRKGKIRDITADSTGRLYMASEILVRYDPYDETITSYEANTAIVSKVCTAVESDKDNRIWLGTKEGGLFLFGYADQARTIEEMVDARDKIIESSGKPMVTIAIVEPINQPAIDIVEENTEPDVPIANVISQGKDTDVLLPSKSSVADLESKDTEVVVVSKETETVLPPKDTEVVVASKETEVEKITDEIIIAEKADKPIASTNVTATMISKELSEENAKRNSDSDSDSDSEINQKVASTNKESVSISKKKIPVDTGTKISILAQVSSQIKCMGDLAAVNIDISGGSPPYNILWSDGVENSINRALSSGNYKINVTDQNGQSVSSNIIIKDVSTMSLNILSQSSPSALERKDGQTKIKVSGGKGPYEISWENGESGDKARRLEGGLHQLTITDQNNCEFITEVKLKGAKILPELQIGSVRIGQKLEIKNIYYEADSTDLTETSFEALEEIFEFLKQNVEVKIEIGGHTNSLPLEEYCDAISTARAKSVAEYLYAKGIVKDRISFIGYGKRNPIASNETKEGRKRNQRVEIKIISI